MRILRKSLKGVKMIKKENKNDFFEIGKTINNVSLMGNLYGRLAELKDLKTHIQTRINELEKEIDKINPLNKQMKNKKITIVLKNCRDDIAKTILIDTKMNMQKYCNVNWQEFRKKGSRIEVQETRNRKEER